MPFTWFRCSSLSLSVLVLAACGDPAGSGSDGGVDGALADSALPDSALPDSALPDAAAPTGLPLLGAGAHTLDAVQVHTLADSEDGIRGARDLAFNPLVPGELWVTNHPESVVVILQHMGTEAQEAARHSGSGGTHFLAKPSALAFGDNGFLATAQEEDEITQSDTPADFMGPTLWTADRTAFEGGTDSHYDMLHNSPNSAGIAWEVDNTYWIFDGYHSSLTRYSFHADHGPGGSDHSDGFVERFAEGEVHYVAGVSSHMEFDHAAGLLFVADTGGGRVAVLDPATARRGSAIFPNYDSSIQLEMVGADVRTLVDGADIGMTRPSGLALHDGLLYVADNLSSRILAFDAASGELIDWVDLSPEVGEGGLMGIEVGPEGNLFFVDSATSRVLRLSPLGS